MILLRLLLSRTSELLLVTPLSTLVGSKVPEELLLEAEKETKLNSAVTATSVESGAIPKLIVNLVVLRKEEARTKTKAFARTIGTKVDPRKEEAKAKEKVVNGGEAHSAIPPLETGERM